MELQTISADDLALWQYMQGDPVMMAELGGPTSKEQVAKVFEKTLKMIDNGTAWVFRVIPDGEMQTAGSVTIWEHASDGGSFNEMGWMILPEFQGRGIASQAVRAVLAKARTEKRWDVIHAYPARTNLPSNALCRKTGFELVEEIDLEYRGHILHCNHWRIDLNL